LGVVHALSRNVKGSTSNSLSKWRLNFLQSDIIVSENKRSTSELLAVQGNIYVVLKISVWVVLTLGKLRNFTPDLAVFVESFRAGPVCRFSLWCLCVLLIVIIKPGGDVDSTTFLGRLMQRWPGRFVATSKLTWGVTSFLDSRLESNSEVLNTRSSNFIEIYHKSHLATARDGATLGNERSQIDLVGVDFEWHFTLGIVNAIHGN